MEEDILNYSPTVMFRGTPCIKTADHNSEISKQGAFDASRLRRQCQVYKILNTVSHFFLQYVSYVFSIR